MDERLPIDRAHLVEAGNGQEKLAPVLLILSIGTALVLSILLLFFPWYYALVFLAVGAVAILTWIKPEIGLILLIFTIPLDVYATFFLGELFAGFTATGVKLLGFTIVISWLVRRMVTKETFRGIKTGGVYGLLFLVVAALSIFGARDLVWALSRTLTLFQLVILSFLCANLVTTPRVLKHVLWAMVIAVVISALLALMQHLGIMEMRRVPPRWGEAVRVVGGMGDPNYFMVTLVMAFFIGLGIFLQERSSFKKIGLIFLAILLLVAGVLTFSRGGAVAFVAAFAYMVVKQRRRVGFLVTVLILVAILIPLLPEPFIQRLSPALAMEDPSVLARLHAWRAATVMWWRNPLVGVGTGNFLIRAPEYLPPGYLRHMVTHNSYFEVLAEIGTLGFILFLALISNTYRSIRAFPDTARGEESNLRHICFGLEIAFVSLLVGSMFLSGQYMKELWLILGLGMALREMSLKLVKEELQEVQQ